jgi:alpha-beta hydrolase superfamily lysophospholipase
LVAEPGPAAGTTVKGKPVTAALAMAGLERGQPGGRGTVVLLHGFNARKEHMLPFAERFCAAGFRCVLFDSRGHGDSGGTYATFGSKETEDLQRVIEGARSLVGPAGLGPLGLMGYSMGGAVALQAQPELPEVKAVATVSTFADFRGVITRQAGQRYSRLGLPLLPLLRTGTQWRAGFDPWSIRPGVAAGRLTCPLFLAHGSDDGLIPVSHVHQLAAAAGSRVRQLMVIPGGTHGRVFITGGDALWGAMTVFFARELAVGRPG